MEYLEGIFFLFLFTFLGELFVSLQAICRFCKLHLTLKCFHTPCPNSLRPRQSRDDSSYREAYREPSTSRGSTILLVMRQRFDWGFLMSFTVYGQSHRHLVSISVNKTTSSPTVSVTFSMDRWSTGTLWSLLASSLSSLVSHLAKLIFVQSATCQHLTILLSDALTPSPECILLEPDAHTS